MGPGRGISLRVLAALTEDWASGSCPHKAAGNHLKLHLQISHDLFWACKWYAGRQTVICIKITILKYVTSKSIYCENRDNEDFLLII